MTSARKFASKAVLVVAAATLLLPAMTACSMEPKVIRSYTQAAGVNASNTTVKLRNVALVAQDGQARLTGLAVSSVDDEITGVTGRALKPDDADGSELSPSTTRVPLTANKGFNLTDSGVQVSSPDLTDGLLAAITISFSHSDPITLDVPVIAATRPDFTPAAPTPSTPANS